MKILPHAAALLLACFAAGRAEYVVPPETNLFGDDIVTKVPTEEVVAISEDVVTKADGPPKTPGFSQMLVFTDGRQLRGELMALARDDVLWHCPGVSEPLHISRGEIRRIVNAAHAGSGENPMMEIFLRSMKKANASSESVKATVKLPGGDWLFGKVASEDGRTFSVNIGESAITVSRQNIAWLYFGERAAPALGLSANGLDMLGWMPSPDDGGVDMAGGVVTARDVPWIGRGGTVPRRFEVSFEVPEKGDERLELWLQPYQFQPNYFGPGTVQLVLGAKKILQRMYFENSESKRVQVPEEAGAKSGPVNYRVLYDGIGSRLTLFRQGVKVSDWPFIKDEDKAKPNRGGADVEIHGIAFGRTNSERSSFSFTRLRVQPWDGVVPQDGTPPATDDRISSGDSVPIPGTLESVGENAVKFSGKAVRTTDGTFVQFPQEGTPLAQADAILSLGEQGEFCAANIEIRDGTLRCHTAFAESVEFPIAALCSVELLPRPAKAAPADRLVFKNGDEIRGALVSVAAHAPLRWRLASGQEIDIDTARIAGIAARAAVSNHAQKFAVVELRNGDHLRGAITALDEQTLQLRTERFGERIIERTRVRMLHPEAGAAPIDGETDPTAWMREMVDDGSEKKTKPSLATALNRWTYIDGRYIFRNFGRATTSENDSAILQRTFKKLPDRFELRFEVTNRSANSPAFEIGLTDASGDGTFEASFQINELTLSASKGNDGDQRSQNLSVAEKFASVTSRRSVRLFVDAKIGTTTLFVDGVLMGGTGRDKADRVPGLGHLVRICSVPAVEGVEPTVISGLWIGAWSGDLPAAGREGAPVVLLANGDSSHGIPTALRDGKLSITESEIGTLELPQSAVQAIDFGGNLTPDKYAARVRLADGSAIGLDEFRCDARELVAHSPTLGELRVPTAEIAELILDPAPVHAPPATVAKRIAGARAQEKTGADETAKK